MRGRSFLFLLVAASACTPSDRFGQMPPPLSGESSGERRPAPPFVGSEKPVRSFEGMSCGELMLEDVGLREAGKGDRHPEVVALRKALAVQCSGDEAGASLQVACLHAREEREKAIADGYGLLHPTVRALDAELLICPPKTQALPPDAAQCASLRRELDARSAEGKGPRHPDVVRIAATLGQCR